MNEILQSYLKKEIDDTAIDSLDSRRAGVICGVLGILFCYLTGCAYVDGEVFALCCWGLCSVYFVIFFLVHWTEHFNSLTKINVLLKQLHDLNSRNPIDKL